MTCVFCKIIEAEIPAKVVYEDEYVLGFLDIKPINLGHTLVVPRNHYESLADVSEEALEKVISAGKKIANALKQNAGIKCDGINLFLADGKAAGQEVFHIHLHIIPRYEGDNFGLKFPSHYGKISSEEIEAVHRKLRSSLE
ncbi:MAG: HIT family protein [Acidobacteria bacterium]|nr:HIT family protein [Acidobacteriota bacterium]